MDVLYLLRRKWRCLEESKLSLYLISDFLALRSDAVVLNLLRLVLKPHRKYSPSSLYVDKVTSFILGG